MQVQTQFSITKRCIVQKIEKKTRKTKNRKKKQEKLRNKKQKQETKLLEKQKTIPRL